MARGHGPRFSAHARDAFEDLGWPMDDDYHPPRTRSGHNLAAGGDDLGSYEDLLKLEDVPTPLDCITKHLHLLTYPARLRDTRTFRQIIDAAFVGRLQADDGANCAVCFR